MSGATTDADAFVRRETLIGAGLMVLAMLIAPSMDAGAKLLGTGAPPFGPAMSPIQIALGRLVTQSVLIAPLALILVGWAAFRPRRMGLILLRGAMLGCALLLIFTALRFMGMAETISIFFVEPLILTVLSAIVLKERIGWRRVVAVLIGLAGAMIIIRPNFLEVGWVAVLPLLCAVCFAIYLLLTKILAEDTPALSLLFWGGFAGAIVIGSALGAASWVAWMTGAASLGGVDLSPTAPTPPQWAILIGIGVTGAISHLMIIIAFRRAPASVLAPLQYFEIFAATAFGVALFGDWPDNATWIGLSLIVTSGLFVFHRERVRAEAP